MNMSEKLMFNIMMSMCAHIEPAAMSILKEVLIKHLSQYTITECEPLPTTAADSNEYIFKLLFKLKKGAAVATPHILVAPVQLTAY